MVVLSTSMGDIKVEVYSDKAPVSAQNFLDYVKAGYYDGTIFHRVIPGFMLQTGDPLGQGTGGPGYKFGDEFDPGLRHDKPGKLSMANAGPGTNGSQFFITERPTPHLDNKHTVFGQCKEVDLVKKIALVKKDPRNNSRPAEPVIIKKIKISRMK